MRKMLIVLSVAGLAACASSTPPANQVIPQNVQVTAQTNQASMSSVPDWFMQIPKSEDHLYSVGDGVSSSVSGALGNARANAFEGICQGAGGTVRSQTKIFRQDTENGSTSMSTTAIRNFCADVSVAGAFVEKSNIVVENGRYHAYVLVGLPLGDKNKVTRTQRNKSADTEVKTNAEREFKELDQLNEKAKVDSAPVSQVQSIELLPVDNEEYKRRRDAALQKDGAVIGHTTLQVNQ